MPDAEPDILMRIRWLPDERPDPPRLRRALKRMLRAYGLKLLKIEWVEPEDEDSSQEEGAS